MCHIHHGKIIVQKQNMQEEKLFLKQKVSVWLTAGVVDRIIYSKSKKKSNTKNKGESKKSKKERSTNAPEWSKYKKTKERRK